MHVLSCGTGCTWILNYGLGSPSSLSQVHTPKHIQYSEIMNFLSQLPNLFSFSEPHSSALSHRRNKFIYHKSTIEWHVCIQIQFSCSVTSDSLQPHGLHLAKLPCPSPIPGACSNSCPPSQWCHPAISSSVAPFSFCPQFSKFQGLLQWFSSSHQVARVSELQLQHQSFQWIFRTDFL